MYIRVLGDIYRGAGRGDISRGRDEGGHLTGQPECWGIYQGAGRGDIYRGRTRGVTFKRLRKHLKQRRRTAHWS